jgi:PucR C-terminal helix-turn-helix domain/GGDEF-like domain
VRPSGPFAPVHRPLRCPWRLCILHWQHYARTVATQPSTADLITEFGHELRREREGLSEKLLAAVATRLPQLRAGPELEHLSKAAALASMDAQAATIEYGLDVEEARPALALEYIRRLAWSGVEPNTISRAYYLGHEWLFDRAQEFTRRRCADPAQATEVLGGLGRALFRFADALSGWLLTEFEAERAAIAQGSAAERAHLVDEILAGTLPDVGAAERTLGYRLSRIHMGVRIWADVCAATGPTPRVPLRETATRIGTLLGSQPPLLIHDGPTVLSAWFPLPADSAPTAGDAAVERSVRDRSGVRAAVGNPGRGVDGFRETRRQADRAYVVATTGSNVGEQVVRYRDVGVVSLLAEDANAARRFVDEELGALARNDAASAVLRTTLLTFLRHGSRHVDTANALYLHRNTVAERLKRAESLLPVPLAARRLQIENALLLSEVMFSPESNR